MSNTNPHDSPDVIVIGGGPGGSTVSTLIAQHGHRVQLFERERFPRFHIGESLIPQTYWVLKRLNMLHKMRGSRFVRKYSVQFVSSTGKLSEPFYFLDNNPHECSQTWQVLRQQFDEMLLNNAREHGVDVHEGARVLEVLFKTSPPTPSPQQGGGTSPASPSPLRGGGKGEGLRAVGVRVQFADGTERDVHAKVVVDASGQSSLIMSRLGLRDWDPILKKAALWTYWEGAYRDTGRDEGTILVMQTQGKNGWFWYIPLHDNITSVGVVAAYDYLLLNRPEGSLEANYATEVSRCPGLVPRIANARRVAPYRAAKEYSYRSRRAAGDGWVLVGDAFGFLDPLYSSGVLLALKSGEMAADAVAEGLAKGDTSGRQLGKWEDVFGKGMDRMRRLVCAFYDGFSFGHFVKRYPHFKGRLTDLLIGDLFHDGVFEEVFEKLDAMQEEMKGVAVA